MAQMARWARIFLFLSSFGLGLFATANDCKGMFEFGKVFIGVERHKGNVRNLQEITDYFVF